MTQKTGRAVASSTPHELIWSHEDGTTGDRLPMPAVHEYTRQVLREAHERDLRLVVEAGGTLADIRAEIDKMTPDQIEQALIAGFRWRHYWRPAQVALRAELEATARRRLMVESSHEISRMVGDLSGRPTFADLQALRSIPATPLNCKGADRCGRCGKLLARCRQVVTVEPPLPEGLLAYCPRHEPGNERAAWCLEHRPELQVAA